MAEEIPAPDCRLKEIAPPDWRVRDLRRQLDAVNEEILCAIERRGHLVLRLMALKHRLGLPAMDAAREREMIKRIAAHVRGPYPVPDIRRIFRVIIVSSRRLSRRFGRTAW